MPFRIVSNEIYFGNDRIRFAARNFLSKIFQTVSRHQKICRHSFKPSRLQKFFHANSAVDTARLKIIFGKI